MQLFRIYFRSFVFFLSFSATHLNISSTHKHSFLCGFIWMFLQALFVNSHSIFVPVFRYLHKILCSKKFTDILIGVQVSLVWIVQTITYFVWTLCSHVGWHCPSRGTCCLHFRSEAVRYNLAMEFTSSKYWQVSVSSVHIDFAQFVAMQAACYLLSQAHYLQPVWRVHVMLIWSICRKWMVKTILVLM